MKKITLKITTFLLFAVFALQVQGQAFNGTPGIYKIKVKDSDPALFVTQDSGVTDAKYQAAATAGNEDTQLFTIVAHPSGTNWSITSQMTDEGALQPNDNDDANSTLGFGTEALASDQQDRWEIRDGINLFLDSDANGTAWDGLGAKRRIQVPSGGVVAGKTLFMSGGTKVNFDFILVTQLSNDKFDSSSIFVSNPVNDVLSIKGLTPNVKQVSVYSLIGKEVMAKKVNGVSSLNLNVSPLASGMYLVEMKGDNGSFTKKIVKK